MSEHSFLWLLLLQLPFCYNETYVITFACLRESLSHTILLRVERAIQLIGVWLVSCRTQVMITFTHSLFHSAYRRQLPPALKSNNQTENDWSHINSTNFKQYKPTPHNPQLQFQCSIRIIIHFYIENKLSNSSIQFACKSYVQFQILTRFVRSGDHFFKCVVKPTKLWYLLKSVLYAIQIDESEEWQVVAWFAKLYSTMPNAFGSNKKYSPFFYVRTMYYAEDNFFSLFVLFTLQKRLHCSFLLWAKMWKKQYMSQTL